MLYEVITDLAKLGHKVTIFESLHKAGGVLSYVITSYSIHYTKLYENRKKKGKQAMNK